MNYDNLVLLLNVITSLPLLIVVWYLCAYRFSIFAVVTFHAIDISTDLTC